MNQAHTAETKFLRLKWRRAFDRWRGKAALLVIAAKGGFDPGQSRVPAGNSDGGRWTGGGGSNDVLTDANPDNFWKPGTRVAQDESNPPKKGPQKPKLNVPVSPKATQTKEPLRTPPRVSKRKPPTIQERNRTAKEVAKWLLKAGKARAPGQIKLFLHAIDGAVWLLDHYQFIQSYLDGPRSLDQLNRDAQVSRKGYERHHIVEQTPAEQDGFPRELIDAPENIASVPTYKHQEISGRYQRKRLEYNEKSLREHLRGKSWEERRQIGLDVLEEFGVLGP